MTPQRPALNDNLDDLHGDPEEVEQATEDELWFLPASRRKNRIICLRAHGQIRVKLCSRELIDRAIGAALLGGPWQTGNPQGSTRSKTGQNRCFT